MGPACACLRVQWVLHGPVDGGKGDRWVCVLCSREFVPGGVGVVPVVWDEEPIPPPADAALLALANRHLANRCTDLEKRLGLLESALKQAGVTSDTRRDHGLLDDYEVGVSFHDDVMRVSALDLARFGPIGAWVHAARDNQLGEE